MGLHTTLGAIILIAEILSQVWHIHDFALLKVPISRSRDGDWVIVGPRPCIILSFGRLMVLR